jgi:predicted  nucleic acid-binding Zn-ribbon protein
MKPTNIRIEDLQKEIVNLAELRDEAKSEWNQHSDESLYHKSKAEEAQIRMLDHNDQIEYRKAKINEMEEQINGTVLTGIV